MKWRVILSENYKMGTTHDVIVEGETRTDALGAFRKLQMERFIPGDLVDIVPKEDIRRDMAGDTSPHACSECGRETILPGILCPDCLKDPMRSFGRSNPYSEAAEYWHVRVRDPKLFDDGTYTTKPASPDHPDRAKLVMARLRRGRKWAVQKVLIQKAAMPDPKEAVRYVKGMRGLSRANPTGAELMVFGTVLNPRGNPTRGNPPSNPLGLPVEDPELPLIYGKTYRIEMRKTHGCYKGQRFFHNFGEGVAMYGLPEGANIECPSGKRIKLPRRAVILVGPRGLWGHYS